MLIIPSSAAFYNRPVHTHGTLVKGETVRAAGACLRVTVLEPGTCQPKDKLHLEGFI